MKRKVVQQGPATLMVSLPSKWVKENNIKKGEEINLEIKGSSITISTEYKEGEQAAELDTIKLGHFNKNYLNALYKKGYDEIRVKYNKVGVFNQIEERIPQLIGLEVIEQTENSCIIKTVSAVLAKEFDSFLRKSFLTCLDLAEGSLNAIEKQEYERLNEVRAIDNINGKFTEFCSRVLYKYGYKESDKTIFIYIIVREIEKIADRFKYICDFVLAHKKIKFNKRTLAYFKETIKYFRLFYELFYNYGTNKLKEFNDKRYALIKKGEELYEQTNLHEAGIISYLMEITQLTYELHNPFCSIVL